MIKQIKSTDMKRLNKISHDTYGTGLRLKQDIFCLRTARLPLCSQLSVFCFDLGRKWHRGALYNTLIFIHGNKGISYCLQHIFAKKIIA